MNNRMIIGLIALAVVIFLATQTFYTVNPTIQVLVRQFGAIVGDPKVEPGLYAKIPLVQDIQRIDRRLLDYEAEESEIIAGDQKRLVVDAYARYRIDAAKLAAMLRGGLFPLAGRGTRRERPDRQRDGRLQGGQAAQEREDEPGG